MSYFVRYNTIKSLCIKIIKDRIEGGDGAEIGLWLFQNVRSEQHGSRSAGIGDRLADINADLLCQLAEHLINPTAKISDKRVLRDLNTIVSESMESVEAFVKECGPFVLKNYLEAYERSGRAIISLKYPTYLISPVFSKDAVIEMAYWDVQQVMIKGSIEITGGRSLLKHPFHNLHEKDICRFADFLSKIR